jgi:aspartokinase-like uncharacterized kinase
VSSPLIIKLGGSLYESGLLAAALQRIAASSRAIILVPGGGPFADAVRAAQQRYGFSDALAHRLAILAMQQMACVIADMQPECVTADTPDDLMRLAQSGLQIPVWAPDAMTRRAGDIPRSWSMTSDGLAAWLAVKLGRLEVCLVKSCPVPRSLTVEALAQAGIVDAEFARIVTAYDLIWHVVGATDEAKFDARFADVPV